MDQPRVTNYTRQEAILPSSVARAATVSVIGVGTVGSHVAVCAADMGIGTLNIFDDDVVEAHNLPSQAYTLDDLGRNKVDACEEHALAQSHHLTVNATHGKFHPCDPVDSGIVVLAVDDMGTRKDIFTSSIQGWADISLMIDARMGGNKLVLYAIDPTNTKQVETYMRIGHSFTQEEAEPIECGGRTVSYVGPIVGGFIANYIRMHLVGEKPPVFTQFNLENMELTKLG